MYSSIYLMYIGFQIIVISEACSRTKRNKPPASNVDPVKKLLSDPNEWWFGEGYSDLCPNVASGSRDPQCANSNANFTTLGSRIFADASYDNKAEEYLKDLKTILTVTYNSPPGNATACNTSFTEDATKTFHITPSSETIPAFYVRNAPELDAPDCTSTSLCTIVFYDAANMLLHNVWVNYPNNSDLSDYSAPGPLTVRTNPYVWLVFKQKDGKQIEEPDTSNFKLTEFMKSLNLKGPIYLSIVPVKADLYGYSNAETFGWYQNCPSLLEIQLYDDKSMISDNLNQSVESIELNTWIPVRAEFVWKTQAQGDSTTELLSTSSMWLNPIDNPCIGMDRMESAPSVFIEPRLTDPSKDDLNGAFFTYILVEIQPESTSNSTQKVRLCWLKKNVEGSKDTGGTTVVPFKAIQNDKSSLRNFYIFALRQPAADLATLENWLDQNCSSVPSGGNCLIDFSKFINSQKLEMSGLNRFYICKD